MNKRKTEGKIRESFDKITPDDLNSVKQACDNIQVERTANSAAAAKRSTVSFWKIATCALALILVAVVTVTLGGILSGGNGGKNLGKTVATVSLDVNPSIELKINADRRVTEANALNADAQQVLADMDLTGVQLQVAVNAVVGSMLRYGYLSDLANSVLVSVDSSDAADYSDIVKQISDEITLRLKENEITASVLTQKITSDKQAQNIADTYGISLGKAQLIAEIVKANSAYTADKLAKLTINELNILIANLPQDGTSGGTEQPALPQTSGTPSRESYIEQEKAEQTAFDKVGVAREQVQRLRTKMDYDNGIMVYEVEFVFEQTEYEIEVDAISGTIVSYSSDKYGKAPVTPSDQAIGKDAAVDKALAHVGATREQVTGLVAKEELDDGKVEYEVEFTWGDYKYEFDIDAAGNVVSFSREYEPVISTGASDEQNFKQRVCEQLNLDPSLVREWDCEIDDDYPNKTVYDIEFKYERYEYEVEVDPTGAILKWHREKDD